VNIATLPSLGLELTQREIGAVSESLGEDSLGGLSSLSCGVLNDKDGLTLGV
jgi:hypothetical protein